MVKGVIFDMDGTMFDTERLLTIAWHKAAGEMGVTISTELMDACRGKSTQAIGGLLEQNSGRILITTGSVCSRIKSIMR